MALVAGMQARPGRMMGHAGAFVGPGEGDALSKARFLQSAGVVLTNHPSKFGDHMQKLLGLNVPEPAWLGPNANRKTRVSQCQTLRS